MRWLSLLPLLRLMWVSVSPSKPVLIAPHPGTCLFKHSELSSLPVCTKQTCSVEGQPLKEVGITESSVPASPWETIHLSLPLSHEGEQKAKAASKARVLGYMSGPSHPAAAQSQGHVFVGGDGGRKGGRKPYRSDQVHRWLSLQRPFRTKMHMAVRRLRRQPVLVSVGHWIQFCSQCLIALLFLCSWPS